MDLSRSDLLKLVSMLEGELQAREIVIAVLKSEQIKRLLNPRNSSLTISGFKNSKNLNHNSSALELSAEQTVKYSSDPLSALSRDSFAVYDPSLDYSKTLALYNMKMYQLENLIFNQNKLYSQAIDQLTQLKTQHKNSLDELEAERKNNEKTMDFDQSKVEKLENEIQLLKKELEERKNHEKLIILNLLNERKQLIIKFIEEKQLNDELKQTLSSEKNKIAEMVEGLEDESKRSLQMEAELEKYVNDFEKERHSYKSQLQICELKNCELSNEVERLKNVLESLQKQSGNINNNLEIVGRNERLNLGEGVRSSIVTMPVATKVHSQSSVNPVFHPKASLAQPVTKIISNANAKTQEVNPNIILPLPSIPVPQPKQSSVSINEQVLLHPEKQKFEENSINEKKDEISALKTSKSDNAVMQTVMFYENSVNQKSFASQSSNNNHHSTSTMKKATGMRPMPPPVPPNKPLIKPVLPSQAILQNKATKDSNAIYKPSSQQKPLTTSSQSVSNSSSKKI